MREYRFQLMDDRPRRFRMFARIFIIVNTLFLVYAAADTTIPELPWLAGLMTAATIAAFTHSFWLKTNTVLQPEIPVLIAFALIYGWLEYWVPAILALAIGAMLWKAYRGTFIVVDEERISYRGIVNRRINWQDLVNVIMKDQYLSIDFKSDRLMQNKVLPAAGFSAIQEKEFNEFCRGRLGDTNQVGSGNPQ